MRLLIINLIEKEDGFILPYILLVTILIVTLLLSLLSIVFVSNRFSDKRLNKKKLELACYSVAQEMIADTGQVDYGTFTKYFDSVEVKIKYSNNGLFDKILAKAKKGKDSAMVEYTIGFSAIPIYNYAIIQSRPDLKLSVAGDTEIKGDMKLSTDHIEYGNVFGIKQAKKDFLNGKIIREDSIVTKLFPDSLLKNMININLPDVNIEKVKTGNFTLDNSSISEAVIYDTLVVNGDLIISGKLTSGKQNNKIIFFVNGKIVVDMGTISNVQIELYCDSTITIRENSTIENCLAAAKGNINIEKNSSFKNIQIYSGKNISIEKSDFFYSSIAAIFVDASDTASLNNSITLQSSIFNGSLLLVSSVTGLSANKSNIYTDGSSKVQGFIYSENNLELRGEVYGTVYTYNFRYYKQPDEYINWMVNLKIDRTKLDKWFLLPKGFAEKKYSEILGERWIY